MTSTVIEAIPNRRFAWQSRPHPSCAAWRRKFFGGRIWRYDFEPDGGATIVRESWDLSEEPGRLWMIWFGFEEVGVSLLIERSRGAHARRHEPAGRRR